MTRLRRAGLILGVVLATAAAGCGAGTGSTGDEAAASATPGSGENLANWMRCMREHGVTVEDPRESGRFAADTEGISAETLEQAQQACRQYVQAAAGDRPNASDPEVMAKYLDFARCMRERGVDLPDPVADANGEVTLAPRTDPKSSLYVDAEQACRSLLPGAGVGAR
ncbi:hypothetical protein [Plantactinospora sp. ZYX-F-223]|uniref:hypothetical protein n=1 Tax=Plantactinospora sp. ZYX-F-223 TaxID=3144103 RepID=UPI0031FD82D0